MINLKDTSHYQITGMLLLLLSVITTPVFANVCLHISFPESDEYSYDDNIEFESFDGVTLAANLLIPKGEVPQKGYPAIIFPNSWALEEHEYLLQAIKFAQNGYVVMGYSARGWGCSGGLVDVMGPNDAQDISAVIDYLVEHAPVDVSNIGMSGISYGAGLSLIGANADSRISAVVAMSTPVDIVGALYENETARLIWGAILTLSGQATGSPSPIVAEYYGDLIFNNNDKIPEITAWAKKRSPIHNLSRLNARKVPVMIANNVGDNLFQAKTALDLYEKLQGPKRIDLSLGTHASVELKGLLGMGDNYVWQTTYAWFDHYLKGKNTGITERAPVTMLEERSKTRKEYSDYPIPEAYNKTFYLHPTHRFLNSKLKLEPYTNWYTRTIKINSLLDSGASTGFPVLAEVLSAEIKLPTQAYIPFINRFHGIVFESDQLTNSMQIRGIPEINVQVQSTDDDLQLVAYLYDVDRGGIGTLITHAATSINDGQPWKNHELSFRFDAVAYDIPAQHRLVMVIDTQDILYSPVSINPYIARFKFANGKNSTLTIPVVNN